MRKIVVGKLSDVKIVGDEIVDSGNLTIFYLRLDAAVSLQSLDGLSPNLSRQCQSVRCTLVPIAATLQEIGLRGINANGNFFRDRLVVALLYCIKDVSVATVSEELPQFAIRLEEFFVFLLHCIHQIRNDGVATYVLRDVLLGVVGPHLGTVVDVLLENVAQHVGIDVAACGRHAVIEMPVPFVEEIEETAESLIGNVKSGIVLLYLVNIEHAAVQIGDAPIDGFKRLVVVGCVQSIVEQADEESFVELVEEAVLALVLLCPLQLMA